jgi:phosphonate transport system permease protein
VNATAPRAAQTPAAPPSAALTPPARPLGQWIFDVLLWGGIAIVLALSFGPAEIEKFPLLFSGSDNMREFGRAFVNPDFELLPFFISQMWLTIQMAMWGTALAVFLAVPLGLLGARNIAPPAIQWPVRRVMDILRSVPDLVIGMVFVVAVGLGPFAGVMALALNTGGVLGKLFSEAVESIDKGPVEGVRATGAHKLQEIAWGVVPQVAPLWTSYALYRFESNSRAATILGLIGAGGIGQILFDSLNSFNYSRVAAIAIVIVVAVTLIDLLSQAIRSRLI